jgi:hypothetical protein
MRRRARTLFHVETNTAKVAGQVMELLRKHQNQNMEATTGRARSIIDSYESPKRVLRDLSKDKLMTTLKLQLGFKEEGMSHLVKQVGDRTYNLRHFITAAPINSVSQFGKGRERRWRIEVWDHNENHGPGQSLAFEHSEIGDGAVLGLLRAHGLRGVGEAKEEPRSVFKQFANTPGERALRKHGFDNTEGWWKLTRGPVVYIVQKGNVDIWWVSRFKEVEGRHLPLGEPFQSSDHGLDDTLYHLLKGANEAKEDPRSVFHKLDRFVVDKEVSLRWLRAATGGMTLIASVGIKSLERGHNVYDPDARLIVVISATRGWDQETQLVRRELRRYWVDFASKGVLAQALRQWRNLYGAPLKIDGQDAGKVGYFNPELTRLAR